MNDQAGRISGAGVEPTLADDIRLLFEAFSMRWRLIAAITAAFLLLGIGYLWVASPAYTSGVDIFVDPRERKLVDLGGAPSGMGSSSQGADNALVQSQVAILKSRAVLSALIEREGLLEDSSFGAAASGGFGAVVKDAIKALIYGPNVGSYGQMSPLDRTMDKLSRAIDIERVGQTYVLNVAVTTGSPEQSARLANAIAEIYIADGQNAVDSSALEAAQSLEARLAELRAVSEASQRAVEDYRSANGLIGAQGVLVDEQQLAELTARVTAAAVTTEQTRAALDEIRRAGANAESILSSDIASQLRMRLDQARSEEQVLAGIYGQRHPRLAQARETRVSAERALNAELSRIRDRAESDHKRAVETERSLKALLDQYQARRAGSNSASVKLRELQQVAEQDRAMFEALAMRAKQAREQVALPSTTARIISMAEPASQPSEPRMRIVLAVSLFLGLVFGFGTAWLMHLLFGPPTPRHARSRQAHAAAVPAAPEPFVAAPAVPRAPFRVVARPAAMPAARAAVPAPRMEEVPGMEQVPGMDDVPGTGSGRRNQSLLDLAAWGSADARPPRAARERTSTIN